MKTTHVCFIDANGEERCRYFAVDPDGGDVLEIVAHRFRPAYRGLVCGGNYLCYMPKIDGDFTEFLRRELLQEEHVNV